jgi:hypothetical protein
MSNFYCPRIKNGIAFTPNRDYDVCGVRNLNLSSKLGISSVKLEDFLSSDYRKNLIATANRGEWPVGCEGCQWLEHIGMKSSRLNEIDIEHREGSKPLVHFNSGNICDSDCIMCGPRWSTSIANRLKSHPDPTETYFVLGNDGDELPFDKKSIQNIKDAVSISKRIKVVGGEPFIDKKLWKFFDEIANKDLELIILTNGNTFPSKKQFQIIEKFYKVQFIFSIDGTALTYEWIRQNLSYKNLIKNYIKIKSMSNAGYHATSVVQAHNLLNLKDLIQAFKTNISFNPLVHPSLLAPRNAPRWVIEQALEETKQNDVLQKILTMSLNAGPTHDFELLKKHTEYLNGHRTHYFDVNTWTVQNKSCIDLNNS